MGDLGISGWKKDLQLLKARQFEGIF